MKLVSFKSYDEYVRVQTETNEAKLGQVWVRDAELKRIARHIRRVNPGARFGLCHGVRNGYEVARARELLGIEVLGTEISETAGSFPHVIQWDFHEVKPEWLGAVDFIYSNSWDHSFQPDVLLDRWLSCLTPAGRCFLEWTPKHSDDGVEGADCFGLSLEEMREWAARHGEIEAELAIRTWETLNPLRWLANTLAGCGAGVGWRRDHVLVLKRRG